MEEVAGVRTTQGQDTSTNVNGVGHSFDGEPGMPLLLVLGLPLRSRQGCAGERDSRFRDDDIPGQVEMKDTYE
jgi:hypothetical protein